MQDIDKIKFAAASKLVHGRVYPSLTKNALLFIVLLIIHDIVLYQLGIL